MHSRVHVCDEIGDLLVALTKCPNAPILIVVEIHGAIHVLIHGVISVPEVVPVLLDQRLALADRPDLVRAALLALGMMTAAVIHAVILAVAIVIVVRVVILAIVQAVIVVRVAILVTVPVVIVVHVVNSAIDLLVILVVATVIVPLVVMALMPVVILVIVPLVIVHHAVILVIDPVEIDVQAAIVARVESTETVLLAIVPRVVNMATDPFVVTTVLTLVVAIVIVHLVVTMEIDPAVTVIVHPAVNSVIVNALRAVTIQDLTHVAATEIVLLVAMAQALAAHRAPVVMTAAMPETEMTGAVDLVAKTSLLADQRTKPNVVVKPCAHVAVAKYAKTASKLRCHVKPRPGLTKAELKMTYAMPPKVQCAVRSHRDAPCRRDQKMKTS